MNQLFTDEGSLKNYYAYPKGLLRLGLSDTDKSVYLLLLDRARLSGRGGAAWRDEQGRVYLFYPIASLARDLGCGNTAVYDALNKLEEKDLIFRHRQGWGRPNRIYVKLPEEVVKAEGHDLRVSGPLTSGYPDPNKTERNKTRDIKWRQREYSSYGTKTSRPEGPTEEEYERLQRLLARMSGSGGT